MGQTSLYKSKQETFLFQHEGIYVPVALTRCSIQEKWLQHSLSMVGLASDFFLLKTFNLAFMMTQIPNT